MGLPGLKILAHASSDNLSQTRMCCKLHMALTHQQSVKNCEWCGGCSFPRLFHDYSSGPTIYLCHVVVSLVKGLFRGKGALNFSLSNALAKLAHYCVLWSSQNRASDVVEAWESGLKTTQQSLRNKALSPPTLIIDHEFIVSRLLPNSFLEEKRHHQHTFEKQKARELLLPE